MDEIQKEAKIRFPIGCTFISNQGHESILLSDKDTYTIHGHYIWAHNGAGTLYNNGIWAKRPTKHYEIYY